VVKELSDIFAAIAAIAARCWRSIAKIRVVLIGCPNLKAGGWRAIRETHCFLRA